MLEHLHREEEDYILESKKKCKDLGMDPNKILMPKNVMTELELQKKKKDYSEILEVIRFFGKKILKSLEGTPILIGISDENGYVLDIFGDETIKAQVNQMGLETGVQFIEEHVGTNVVSLTLKQNHPVQLIGKEHYHTHLHNSACYGVPFHYTDEDDLLGTICIMTGVILHNPFFLMTLTTVVDAIERELLLRKQNRKINKQKELLYQSEKKQRELLQKDLIMKDEFITLITHEFKTPINVIYSAIQLIEHLHINKLPDNVKSLIKSIKHNTFRELRLVNNLLDITRLNLNQFKFNFKNIDIVNLTNLIVKSVNPYANQKKINLCFESNVENLNLLIDDENYERIILNILSNSIKFTPEGGNIIVLINKNEKKDIVVISIKDTGVGIPKEKQNDIFERFGQVENNLSRQAEGTGIGLALVKKLMDELEGRIEVASEVGSGSTFTITLPIKKTTDSEESEVLLEDYDSRIQNAVNVEFSDIYF